jgi:hypothetical protein
MCKTTARVRVGNSDFPAEHMVLWHARGREGRLAPAPIDKSQQTPRGQAALPDHEHATGFWSLPFYQSPLLITLSIELNRRPR